MHTCFKIQLSIGFSALLGAAAANATELCVKCSAPEASYACVVNGTSTATVDTVAKLYCITALAKSGAHESCSVDRTVTAPCPGERKELPFPAALDGQAAEDQPQPDASPGPAKAGDSAAVTAPQEPLAPATLANPSEAPHDPAAGAPQSEPPPKTVQEMVEKSAKTAGAGLSDTQKSAGDAAKSATTALEKAGAAVGGAAKSSWKCLSSFFTNC
ncbi:hypothetical protein SAMN04488557_0995 [Hyphomicrobium facile]|uniref:Uncharacterized protein n=1 Tax=Hyphomicrobium facile TaxID=51670 RepID=A0A1I7N184_9HYPH|nr:hypothetical protein SAMN04488557_0995 [Hyphomicrobium facile]